MLGNARRALRDTVVGGRVQQPLRVSDWKPLN
jgi:hypothetical protein